MKKILALICALVIFLPIFSGCDTQGGSVTVTPTIGSDAEATPTPLFEDIKEKTDYVTEMWVAKEIEFTANKKSNSISKTELDVTFMNRTTGTTMIVPGFWDGDKSWKVRFAPTEYGIWDFETKTTGDDIGINGIKGTLASNAYKGDLAIYKNGFVKTEKNL